MAKQIRRIVREAEEFLKNGSAADKEGFLAYLMRWIVWLQHERLVHLMVTLFFALFSMLVAFAFVTVQNMVLLLLFLIFAITTGFNVNHYYLLENKTQYLYELYDKIESL